MATITSNNGKLSLTKKNKKENERGIVSNNGKLTISKKQEPKKVEDAIFASSTLVADAVSGRKFTTTDAAGKYAASHGNNEEVAFRQKMNVDVVGERNKRDNVDEQITALEEEKKTWEREKTVWENSQFRGPKWEEADEQIARINAEIERLDKAAMSQDEIDEAQETQDAVAQYRAQQEEEKRLLNMDLQQAEEQALRLDELRELLPTYENEMDFWPEGSEKHAEAKKAYEQTKAEIDMLEQGYSWEDIDKAAQVQRKAELEQAVNYVGFDNVSKYKPTTTGRGTQNVYVNNWQTYRSTDGWGDLEYELVNKNPAAIEIEEQNRNAIGSKTAGSDNMYLTFMTDDEVAVYNYYYVTNKALKDEYVQMLKPELLQRQMMGRLASVVEAAESGPVGASLVSVGMTFASLPSYIGQVMDYVDDGRIETNAGYNFAPKAQKAIRDTVGEKIEKQLGEKWGKAGSFAYQLGMSMADFLAVGGLTAGLGAPGQASKAAGAIASTILGGNAAAQTTLEAKARGLTDGQALALGTISGVAEWATETWSVEKLLDMTALGKSAGGYMLQNITAEGSEEGISGLVNLFADILISRDKSQWQQAIDQYIQNDYDEKSAFAMALSDQVMAIGLDVIGGGISGGIMSAGGVALNEAGYAMSRPSGAYQQRQELMDAIMKMAEEDGGFEIDERAAAGDDLPDGGRGRLPGQSAGEQSGTVRQTGTVDQAGRADDRRSRAQAAGLQPVSGKEQDIPRTTANRTFSFMPEETWDDEMRTVYDNVYKRTGKKIEYIIGQIEIDKGNGVVGYARGVWTTDGRIIVQADHPTLSVGIIAGHEKFHSNEFTEDELLQIKQKVIQGHTQESLERVLQDYWTRLKSTIGRDSQGNELTMEQAQRKLLDEVFADADAGINEYDAAKFGNVVREESERILTQRNAPKQQVAQATQRTTGPPQQMVTKPKTSAETDARKTELEQVLEQMSEQLAAGNITEEEYDAVYDEIMSQPEMQDSMFSMDAEEKKSVIADLRTYLSGGMTAQQLNERIGQRGAQVSQRAEKSTLSNEAQKIKNAARRQRVSVEEYLHRNWELFDVDGQWNEAAREALDDERGVRFSADASFSIDDEFENKCKEIEEGTLKRSENPFIYLSRGTPEILQERAKAKDLPLIISYESLYLAVRSDGDLKGHYHALGYELTAEIAKKLNDPEMILQLDNGRINEIVRAVDKKGRQVVASIELDATKDFDGGYHAYHLVITIFGAKQNYINNLLKQDGTKILYPEKNTAEASQVNPRLNELSGIVNEDTAVSNDSVREEEGVVKSRFSEEADVEVSRDRLNTKATNYLRGVETSLTRGIKNTLGVTRFQDREDLTEIVRQLSDEYLKTGTVQQESIDNLFEQAYQRGIVVDDTFYNENKDIKTYLRKQAISLSEYAQHDIPDWKDWRKAAFGLLNISKGGLPVSVAYEELREMAPYLFPETITAPSDQIQRMRDVSDSIRKVERNLDGYHGPDAQEFKRWAKADFETAISEHMNELRAVRRYAQERAAQGADIEMPQSVQDTLKLYEKAKQLRRDRDKVRAKNLLTDSDEMQLGRLHRGEITLDMLPEGVNAAGIERVYLAEREYEQVARVINEYNRRRKAQLKQEADGFLETANEWKDKKRGIQYARETQERNIRDIVPDEELAQRIIDRYFTPVHEAQAKATAMKNEYRQKVKDMHLSRKVEKGNLVSEAHAVQLLGEAEDNIRVLENSRGRMKMRDGKTLAEWKDVVENLWAENPKLNEQKIRDAVEAFRKIYDTLFQRMNETRVRNGYEPINYRQGYFPHFQPNDTDGILGAFSKALGIDMQTAALPTSINGLTHTFKPGIQWFGNAQERLGFNTAYDAMEGFDKYIEGVADVIFQTDNIQALRALASQIRYRSTTDAIRQEVDRIRERNDLTEQEKESLIQEKLEKGPYALSNFVVDLEEYTNLLANKKSRADRNMEQALGRGMYQRIKALESRVAANMVAVNPGSWLTNFIPLTQGGAQLGHGNLLQGMWQTLKNYKVHDGFEGKSAFLTNRRGSDPLVKTWSQKASDVLSAPMEYIDTFVADSLVRARTIQNVKAGMSEDAAIREADAWAAGVMADRSKGSLPTLFNRTNPLTKVFTQFQLEVNNQFSYLFKDLPREQKKKGVLALTAALLKFFLGAWLYNEIYEYFIGRRPAMDPIGMLNDTVGDFTGYEVPNLVEAGVSLAKGEDVDFTVEKQNRYTALENLFVSAAEELPFIGGVLGGGRVPIQSALPDVKNLAKAAVNEDWSAEKKWATVGKELMAPATYLLPPFGGGQVKKLLQGIKATIEGGRYTVDAQGNKKLQYPVYKQEAVTAAIFGPTATTTGREWIENDFPTLGINETAAYQALRELGMDEREAYELVTDVRAAEKTETMSEAEHARQVLRDAYADEEAKGLVYYSMLASDKEKELMDVLSESNEDLGSMYQMLDGIRLAENSNAKRQAIMDANLTDEEKRTAYQYMLGTKQDDGSYLSSREDDIDAFLASGLKMDDFLKAQNEYTAINEAFSGAGDKAVEFSWWLDKQNWTNQQKQTAKEAFKYYSQIPQTETKYDKFTGAGLSDRDAYNLNEVLSELQPEEGKDSVSARQKYKAIADEGLSDEDTMKAFSAVMTESEYKKVTAGFELALSPRQYANVKYTMPQFDENQNGSYSNAEVEAAIDAYAKQDSRLDNGDKSILWQMLTGSTSAKNNPYSRTLAERYLEELNKLKGEE